MILLLLTLLLSFTGYLLPWDQLALWAVAVGTSMMGYTPVLGDQVRFVLLGCGGDRAVDAHPLVCAARPGAAVRGDIFLAVHFWRIRKDGGISGPL